MANLKDRVKAEKKSTPTDTAVGQILGKTEKKKYAVSVVFDREHEQAIRDMAKAKGVGVATFIKMCVLENINKD